jgi:hypothetical protein
VGERRGSTFEAANASKPPLANQPGARMSKCNRSVNAKQSLAQVVDLTKVVVLTLTAWHFWEHFEGRESRRCESLPVRFDLNFLRK